MDLDVIVSEVYRLSRELLSIQSYVNKVAQVFRIEVSHCWYSCHDFAFFIYSLSQDPAIRDFHRAWAILFAVTALTLVVDTSLGFFVATLLILIHYVLLITTNL